jgi:hypothetical protein
MEFVGVHGMNQQFHISNRLSFQNRKALGDQGEQACRMQDLVIESRKPCVWGDSLAIIPMFNSQLVN